MYSDLLAKEISRVAAFSMDCRDAGQHTVAVINFADNQHTN